MDAEIKVIIDMFANMVLFNIDKKLDEIELDTSYKTIFNGYEHIYGSLIIGAKYAIDNLKKIENLLDSILKDKKISREELIQADLHSWSLNGEKKLLGKTELIGS